MHVVEFLVFLSGAPYVEVVETTLPKARVSLQGFVAPKTHLRDGGISLASAKGTRDTLLQHLHDGAWRADIRLTDQQVDVCGHDHVSQQGKVVVVASFAEDFEEEVAPPSGREERETPITAASDEMQVIPAVAAFQPILHEYPSAAGIMLCQVNLEKTNSRECIPGERTRNPPTHVV